MRTKTLDAACLGGLLALAIGGSFVVAGIASAEARRIERHNAAIEARSQELKQAQSVLAKLDGALRSNQSALDALRERLPESGEMGRLLSGLDAVARRNSVDLSQLTPGTAVDGELCRKTSLQLKCRGPFSGLHALLYELETMPRLVRVERVNISRNALKDTCTMDVACSVYSR